MFKKITFIISIACFASSHALENIPQKPTVVPRASWGANELFTEIDSDYWKAILEARKNTVDTRSPEKIEEDRDDYEKSINYINDNFAEENTITHVQRYDENTGKNYAWPLKYTDYVNAIIIHHTHSEFEDDITGLKSVYKYHSLSNWWGDIGYHYIIGNDGIIYEWKKGGDYVAGAHSKWNNYSTVWVALLWDYHDKPINELQYRSLENLVQYLAWNYGIDFSKQYYYHMDCAGEKCNTFPLETYRESTLSGHRDTGHTGCPWDELYAQLQKIREDNLEFTKWLTPKKRPNNEENLPDHTVKTSIIAAYSRLLHWYSPDELSLIKSKIDELLEDESIDSERRKKLQILRLVIILKTN